MADPQVIAVVDRPIAAPPTLRPVVAWTAIIVLVVLPVIRSAVATRTDGFTIEYFNEIIGGPERAYLYFGDESVDIGQRRLDFVRLYREHLEPAGEVPYLLYPVAPSEQKRRGVRTMGEWRTDSQEDIQWPDVSGIFFLSAVQINRNPRYGAFSGVPPVGRIGDLLIYRGTFHIPWLRERQLLVRANRLRTSPEPDLDKAEALLREVLTINPNSFGALLTLGNLMLRRNRRKEALRFTNAPASSWETRTMRCGQY